MKKINARFFLFLVLILGTTAAVYIAQRLKLDFSDLIVDED